MYETHFGLKRRPFRALALGNDVFIGPQSAATLAGVKKALTTADAIAAVIGQVGGGKTTVVGRALDGVSTQRVVIPVGRIKLGHDEVLELLLEELGVEDLPKGTVQRFTMFRRLLKEFADKQTRVIVVVEDAVRVGPDALSELEALTAADSGVSGGANIVLMGDAELDARLDTPALARLKQRLRLRHVLAPLSAKELLGYFKHCFRLAGGDFDAVFAPGGAELIHQLSGGIPRMANNIAESAMVMAAETGLHEVAAEHINKVAADEYGMTAAASAPVYSVVESPLERETAPAEEEPAASPQSPAVQEEEAIPELAVESNPALEPSTLVPDVEASGALAEEPQGEIPELIQDTLPDLAVLTPELVGSAPPELTVPDEAPSPGPEIAESAMAEPDVKEEASAGSPDPMPQVDPEPADAVSTEPQSPVEDEIPTLSATQPPIETEEVPAWDRDPTLAELRPDLDALEHAMAVAHGVGKEAEGAPAEPEGPSEHSEPSEPEEAAEPVPEITLDREIQAKIEEAAEAIKRTEEAAAAKAAADAATVKTIDIAATGEIEVDLPPLQVDTPAAEAAPATTDATPAQPEPAANDGDDGDDGDTEELQRIANNLSRARTIDDVVDDQMAETLFGDEFSEIAAKVAAKASEGFPANDELELVAEDPVPQSAPAGDFDGAAAVSVAPTADPAPAQPKPDAAAEQRLATVRALNGTPDTPPPPPSAESIVMTESGMIPQPPVAGAQPDSIEDQITTSITQTLKALNTRLPATDEDEDEEEKKGFFSRFRKS